MYSLREPLVWFGGLFQCPIIQTESDSDSFPQRVRVRVTYPTTHTNTHAEPWGEPVGSLKDAP